MEDDKGEEEEGEARQEAGDVWVIVGSDRGGQCQASFRILSLRSSCSIVYPGKQRGAIFIRGGFCFEWHQKGPKKKETREQDRETNFLLRRPMVWLQSISFKR